MAQIGFGAEVRKRGPEMGRWMTVSLVITVVYLVACVLLCSVLGAVKAGAFLTITFYLPTSISSSQAALIFELVPSVPFLVSLLLTIPYRVAEASIWAWLGLILRATLIQMIGWVTVLLFARFIL